MRCGGRGKATLLGYSDKTDRGLETRDGIGLEEGIGGKISQFGDRYYVGVRERKKVTLSCTLGPGVDAGKTPEITGNKYISNTGVF